VVLLGGWWIWAVLSVWVSVVLVRWWGGIGWGWVGDGNAGMARCGVGRRRGGLGFG